MTSRLTLGCISGRNHNSKQYMCLGVHCSTICNSQSMEITSMPINRRMDKGDMVRIYNGIFSSVQFGSVTQSCPTLCNPMNRSTPGLPVHHQLPEFTQTCVHRVSDAIQPSHPLLSPSPPTFNLPQHQGLFK